MTVAAIVGAQYGSEGKGAIAAKVADQYNVHVRTGAPNAGHTYYVDQTCDHSKVEWKEWYRQGEYPSPVPTHWFCPRCEDLFPNTADQDMWQPKNYRHKVVARSIPCGASNPNAHLVIGPGGLIDVDLLIEEVLELESLGIEIRSRLLIDRKCAVIDKLRHHEFEGGTSGEAHRSIGSTGEGVGPARMAKISRGTFARSGSTPAWSIIDHVGDANIQENLSGAGIITSNDTARILDGWIDAGSSVMLEGTQGSGLSLIHGPWPFVTSTDTNSAQLCVDAGISPKRLDRVILVARTFPIRVAGNSGPLSGETSFEELGVDPEFTTVTKKMRRIGAWDDELFAKAILLNGPWPQVALTFADYVDPEIKEMIEWGSVTHSKFWGTFAVPISRRHNVTITMVGTGPDSVAVR